MSVIFIPKRRLVLIPVREKFAQFIHAIPFLNLYPFIPWFR